MNCQPQRGNGIVCLGFHEPKFPFCTKIVPCQTETVTCLSDRPHNKSDLLHISNRQFLRGLAAPALMGVCPGTLCPVPLVRSWIRSGDAEQIAHVLHVPVQLLLGHCSQEGSGVLLHTLCTHSECRRNAAVTKSSRFLQSSCVHFCLGSPGQKYEPRSWAESAPSPQYTGHSLRAGRW